MVIKPYKRPPEPPTMALLTESAQVIDERGREIGFDDWPAGVRCFTSYDTVRALIQAGQGEAICWQNEEIHWRHARLDPDGWTNRPSDVHVIRYPFPERDATTLRGLAAWRDWLATYGAAPTGTHGSTSWSLLRATISEPLQTSEPISRPEQVPPIMATLGGRQQLGPRGAGSYTGQLQHWDLPAAYANTLGQITYGGRWIRCRDHLQRRPPEFWAAEGRPVFVRCVVGVEAGAYGPLPLRPIGRRNSAQALGLGVDYPTGRKMQGIWTFDELAAMEACGAGRILRVIDSWAHLAGDRQPLLPWLQAIHAGRAIKGLGGQLAKMTGNALWGRLCVDARNGRRTIRSSDGKRMTSRPLPMGGGVFPAHDLAETVSGRVRARLFRAMSDADRRLLSAHTDGLWVAGGAGTTAWAGLDEPWLMKQGARRLDLLGPQCLRYWPRPWQRGAPFTVISGTPPRDAERRFDELWAEHEQREGEV